jgi:hypothetical protein
VKRAFAVLAVAAGLAGLLLVGSEGNNDPAQAAVKRTAATAVATGSSRFEMTVTMPQSFQQSVSDYSVEGVMDYVHHRGRIFYPGDSEVLFDGNVTYMKWPLPWRHDARWLRSGDAASDADPFDLQDRATRNPIGLLGFLTGAGNDVRVVDTENVRGVSTQHYEGTLDLQKVVDQAPAEQRAELLDALDFLAEDEPTTVPFGLWVDGDGVAHRLRIDEQGGSSVTIEYYDFGVPVEITPPPAEEIMSDNELMKELEQHANDSSCDKGDAGSGGLFSSGSGDTPDASAATSLFESTGSGSSDGSGSSSGDNGGPTVSLCFTSFVLLGG